MQYLYKTKNTCSTEIRLNIEGDVVTDVSFTGGCNGNLKAIPALVNGLTVDQIEKKLSGITCGNKQTSCGDQLAKACRAAFEEQQKCAGAV
ncbi:MAG: TIGR03905 family TSCPD domain-containing protein [Eubacterium sp.]|nr:TIGR03905 family TSCPD domain-containing protein [Eubacterium sp.]